MSGSSLYKPSSSIIEKSHVNRETYEKMYEESINDPSLFWQKHGKRIDWIKPYSKVNDVSYNKNTRQLSRISLYWGHTWLVAVGNDACTKQCTTKFIRRWTRTK